MAWELRDDRPIYLQLMEQVKRRIVSGKYPAGSKLPAVRELASQAAVNPNTMQKALSELEREGLVYSQRTSGRYITEDEGMIREIKEGLAREQAEEFFKSMMAIGYNKEDTLALLQSVAQAEKQNMEVEEK